MRVKHNDKNVNINENMSIEVIDSSQTEVAVEDALTEDTADNEYDSDYNSDIKEWDLTDDEDIQEFLTRDFDVIAESRRRIQNNQNKSKRAKKEKKKKEKSNQDIMIADLDADISDYPESNQAEKAIDIIEDSDKKTVKNNADSKGNALLITIKGWYNSWLNVYHKNTMQILFGALMALSVILVIAIIATYPGDVSDKKETDTVKTVEKTTEEVTTEAVEEETVVAETAESEIHKLVLAYIDAVYVNPSMDAVTLIMDDTTNFKLEMHTFLQEYADVIENVVCYKFEITTIEKAYIVYYTYDLKLNNMDTSLPMLEEMVVKYNEASGKYMVHNLNDQEKRDLMLTSGEHIEFFKELEAANATELQSVLATDSKLKEVYDLMANIAAQSETTAATTAPESATSAGETETTTAAQ